VKVDISSTLKNIHVSKKSKNDQVLQFCK